MTDAARPPGDLRAAERMAVPLPGVGVRWLIGFVFGALGAFAGVVATYTRYNDTMASAAAHQVAFEKAVWERFDGAVKDRDERLGALNAKADQLGSELRARAEKDERAIEGHGDRLNAVENRTTGLESKICYLAGVRCK